MNQSLFKLTNSALKESRLIIGLMSGTSLDGLDIALCKVSGFGSTTIVTVLNYETASYSEAFKDDIKTIFSKKQVDLEKLTLLNASIGSLHGELINQFLKKYSISKTDIDCIASHGQTIYHAPKRLHLLEGYSNATLQIGDGDHIAVKTGIPVINDFRQKHIAAGGEGAPLALYGDYILFSSEKENRILLNIGGISNFTYLPKKGSSESIVCTDLGPGNTLIDRLAKKYFDLSFDEDGAIAQKGTVSLTLSKELFSHPFFEEKYPKTTGPELFSMQYFEDATVRSGNTNLDSKDLISTATQFTADAIKKAINDITDQDFSLYVSGGGSHNKSLINRIAEQFPLKKIGKMEELGISGDAKEAVLFAILANETICGSRLETHAGPEVMMGRICLPE